jgi:hypothetical protein
MMHTDFAGAQQSSEETNLELGIHGSKHSKWSDCWIESIRVRDMAIMIENQDGWMDRADRQ